MGVSVPKSETSMSEALLFTTMCMVGLPVEVHVRDGSVYSAVFHTASVHEPYSIVLKKAMKIMKRKSDKDLPVGELIDTLVVLSDELVQVVAKGVHLPGKGLVAHSETNGVPAVIDSNSTTSCNTLVEKVPKQPKSPGAAGMRNSSLTKENSRATSAVRKSSVDKNADSKRNLQPKSVRKSKENVYSVPISHDDCSQTSTEVSQDESHGNCLDRAPLDNRKDECEVAPSNSSEATISPSDVDVPASSSSCQRVLSPENVSVAAKDVDKKSSLKGSKLNPQAKTFIPSNTRSIQSSPASFGVETVPCILANVASYPVGGPQPADGSSSYPNRPSFPTKTVVQCNSVVPNFNYTQHSRPIGHLGARQQPTPRLIGLHHPAQGGAAHLPPNCHTATAGRVGQPVYMPMPEDPIQGVPARIEMPPLPFTPHQANLHKFPFAQGNIPPSFPFVATLPAIATGPLPFMPPNVFLVSHPLHTVQPVAVPINNTAFNKFF